MKEMNASQSLVKKNHPAESGHAILCSDGKYRWVYELDMLRNPSLLILVFKVFCISILIVGGFIFLLVLYDGDSLRENLEFTGKLVGIMCGIVFTLGIVSYLILAATFNWKYVVLYEMDEEGIECRQLKKQVKKSKAIGFITTMVGIATGNPTAMGAGLLAATQSTAYSTFASVRAVKPYPRRNLIKVNEPFFFNQVYAEDEDFDFVFNYIRSHCPKVK